LGGVNVAPEIVQPYPDSLLRWKLFRAGFWLLMFSYSALVLIKTRWQINSIYLSAPLLCAGMFFLLISALINIRQSVRQLNPASFMVFVLLCLWCTVTALRGFTALSVTAVRDMWGIRYFAWAWFVPVLMLLAMDPLFLRQLLNTMMRQAYLGMLLLAVVWLPPLQLFTDFHLLWGCSALLIFWQYLPAKSRRIALAGSFLSVLFGVLASERNAVFAHVYLMMAAGFVALVCIRQCRGRRLLGIISIFLFSIGLVYYASLSDSIPFLSDRINTRIEAFKNKVPVNTRYGENANLYLDFLKDMEAIDLWIGRGSIGTYSTGGLLRPSIECGYLQVILKGGGIMLFLLLFMAMTALFKGLFASKNWVVKGFALIVAGWLMEMIPFGNPSAFPRYALFWFAVGVCHNKQLRAMTDEQIGCFVSMGKIDFREPKNRPDDPVSNRYLTF